jgi:hypothetical protein
MKFKEVIHYVGIFFLFLTILLGGLLWNGEPLLFILGGIVLSFAVYYLVKLMLDKKEETHPNFYHLLILWTLYIFIGVFGGLFSLHFITVQWVANEDLRNNGNEKIEAILEMRTEFKESVNEVTNDLSDEVSACFEAFVNAPRKSLIKKEKEDILVNVYKFSAVILSELDRQNIDKKAKDWVKYEITYKIDAFNKKIDKELNAYYANNKDVFNDMDYFNKNKVYYELDSILSNNKNKLEDGFTSVISQYNKSNVAFHSLIIPSSTVQLNSLGGLRNQYNPFKSIVIYLIIHLLILFPFLITNSKFRKPKPEEDITTTPIP